MKVGLFSHCTIDSIVIGDSSFEQVGGPACYGSFAAKELKFDVQLYTRFGPDFPHDDYLSKNEIKFENAFSEKSTTRFKIQVAGVNRTLLLENSCEPIVYGGSAKADGFVISPVFDEINPETFERIKNDSNFVFLDPQGFLRRVGSDKKIFLEKTEIALSKVTAIKADPEEISILTGRTGHDAMLSLQKRGVDNVLFTNKREISLLVKDRVYSITLPNIEAYDTTGIGDIFSTTFCCTMLKENDFFWALCFAGGAAQAALETKALGLEKVPKRGATQTNAAYFYNTVKFEQV